MIKFEKIPAYILTVVMVLLCFSCSTFKESSKSSVTREKQNTVLVKDSTAKIETSLPIKDNIVINVPRSQDEALNKALDAILSNLNTSKTSGNNSYKSTYDAENQRLLIEFLIGQTQNKDVSIASDSKIETSFEQQTDAYFSKKLKQLPWWVYLAAIVYFLPIILDRVKMIISPFGLLINKIKNQSSQ